jgi:hypothetical protein
MGNAARVREEGVAIARGDEEAGIAFAGADGVPFFD